MEKDDRRPWWIKSSLSFANGNCVEVAWVKSTESMNTLDGNCVEAADLGNGEIGIRNSRDPEGPVLRFTPEEMKAFIGGVRNGEFDRFAL
jgi:hypothetical protein